jgi:hypothetical protein
MNLMERISQTVMEDILSAPIDDFENEIPRSFPGEETSLGSGLPSHPPSGDVPCPHEPLLTVFSTIQSDHLITQGDFKPSRFLKCYQSDVIVTRLE